MEETGAYFELKDEYFSSEASAGSVCFSFSFSFFSFFLSFFLLTFYL
jgi:hypothetical protein